MRDHIAFFICIFFICFLQFSYAADTCFTLDSADGTSSFILRDSYAAEIGEVDSNGNMVIRGGLRLDAGGVECTTAEMLVVDGRIGIGTVSPSAPLHAVASGTNTAFLADNDNAADEVAIRFAKEGIDYASIQLNTDHDLSFQVHNGSDWKQMLRFERDASASIIETGEVGILTVSPEKKLHVNGDVLISNDSSYMCEDTAGNNVQILTVDGADNVVLNAETLTTANDYPLIVGGTVVDFRDKNNSTTVFMDESGEVGIGTTDPEFPLDVESDSNTSAKFGNTHPIYMVSSAPSIGFNTYWDGAAWRFGKNSVGNYAGIVQMNHTNGDYYIYATDSGNADALCTTDLKLTIKNSGNVGFGTGAPAEKLEVNGVMQAEPVCGRWYATNHGAAGGVRYQWTNEIFNTNTTYFDTTDSDYDITFYKAGYYLLCVNVLQAGLSDNERGDVYLRKNDVTFSQSLGIGSTGSSFYKHEFFVTQYFAANDTLDIYNASAGATVYGNNDIWSTLSIVRLN